MTATALVAVGDAELRAEISRQLIARGLGVVGVDAVQKVDVMMRRAPPQVAVIEVADAGTLDWLAGRMPALGHARLLVLSRAWPPPPSLRSLACDRDAAILMRAPPLLTELVDQLDRLLSVGASSVPVGAPELVDELAQARARYARRLPGLLDDVARSLALAREGDGAAASQAERLAHRLAGTAGSYGFVAVSEAMGALEAALEPLLSGGDAAAAWPAAETALARGLRALAGLDVTGPVAADAAGDPPARYRLLVLDDDDDFLRYVVAVGRRHAVQVLAARTPAAALESARACPPDAALLDVHLDDASSFDLTRQLRALPGCEALPLAFVSADTRPETRAQAAYAGGGLFVTKPLDEQRFTATLAALVETVDRRRPRVLVVDDDPAFNSYVSVVLQRGGMLTQTLDDPARILERLARLEPELLLLDVAMTGLSGFDVCRLVRTAPEWRHLVIIFVTAQGSGRSRANAFAAGADDFLVKPIVDEELLAHVRVHLDNQRLRRAGSERDAPTGLATRASFVAAARARLGTPSALALVALDGFDALDGYGLTAGERVLGEVGHLVAARFSRDELRCRWGEATFALAFGGEEAALVPALVERLRAEIAALRFTADDGRPFAVRASAGLATSPADGTTLEALAAAAATGLERARRGGGDRGAAAVHGGARRSA